MEGMSRQCLAATYPPDRFYCLLDELPLHLVPMHARKHLSGIPEKTLDGLILNPDCDFRPADDLPKVVAESDEVRSVFASQGVIAWVRSRGGSLWPFWLGPCIEATINEIRSGKSIPNSTPKEMISVLTSAGILVQRDEDRPFTKLLEEERTAKTRILFRSKEYAAIPSLLHPFHVAVLRRYYRALIRQGRIQLGDAQSSLRYAVHNDPVARFFHRQLTRKISDVAGEPLKPSYVYLASYQSGAELKKHTDREQCEFSITLCLDFSPEPILATPWPICLQTPNSTVQVYQALGDGLAYRGTRLPHFRSPLGPGQTSTSIFFHYVSESFRGPLN